MPVGLGKGLLLGGSSRSPAVAIGHNGALVTYGLTVYLPNGEIDDRYNRLELVRVNSVKWHSDGVRLLVATNDGPMVLAPGVVGTPPFTTTSRFIEEAWDGSIFAATTSGPIKYSISGTELTQLESATGLSMIGIATGALTLPGRRYLNEFSVALGGSAGGYQPWRMIDFPEKTVYAHQDPFGGDREIRCISATGEKLGNDGFTRDTGNFLAFTAQYETDPNIAVATPTFYLSHEAGYPTLFPQPSTGTLSAEAWACAWSPDGRWLAFSGEGGYLFIDTETKTWDFSWPTGDWLEVYESCAWSKDGSLVAFGKSLTATSMEWVDVATKSNISPWPTLGRIQSIDFHPSFTADDIE